MDDAKLKTAVISGSRELRSTVTAVLKELPDLMSIVADVPSMAARLDSEALELLHAKDPEVVIADFDGDPVSSLRFIRLLSDARPSRVIIGAGPELEPGLLMEAMRSGVSEYLPTPISNRELSEALRRVARKLGRGPSGSVTGGRVLVFTGAKGGAGVSTAAVNAAVHAAELTDRRVLLLDLDLEGGTSAVLTGVAPRYSLLDLIDNLHRADESLLASLVIEHESGLHVLPAPVDLVSPDKIQPDQLRTVFRLLRQHYALTVVDVSRPLSALAGPVIEQADELFLVLNADLPSLRNAKRILPRLRESMNPTESELRILLNRAVDAGEIGEGEVRTALQLPVAFRLRRDEDAVLHSVNVGHPIVLNGSRSRYCADVKALGLDVARSIDPDAGHHPGEGFLTRLKTRFTAGAKE
jgi:pilus assembly protein CpaE